MNKGMTLCRPLPALLLLIWLLLLVGLHGWGSGRPFLPVDDLGGALYPRNPYVSTAETARDLWRLGTLERPAFHELRAFFLRESAEHAGVEYRQDVFSLSLGGRLLPKHPLLPSLLGAPVYALAGTAGFWVMEQLVIVALAVSGYRVARSMADQGPSLVAAALLLLGTKVFWFYSYTFSYDLLGAALIVGGLALLPARPVVAGLLWGLALHIRVTHGILFPFLLLACHPWRGSVPRAWLCCTLACLLAALPHFIYGAAVFGDALRGSYARVPVFAAGTEGLDADSMHLSLGYLREAGERLLWGGRESVFFAYPALAALPWALGGMIRPHTSGEVRRKAAWITAGALASLVLHLSYSYWIGSGGDRFVLAAACVVLPLLALGMGPSKRCRVSGSGLVPADPG